MLLPSQISTFQKELREGQLNIRYGTDVSASAVTRVTGVGRNVGSRPRYGLTRFGNVRKPRSVSYFAAEIAYLAILRYSVVREQRRIFAAQLRFHSPEFRALRIL
jgi:hypothetical protein